MIVADPDAPRYLAACAASQASSTPTSSYHPSLNLLTLLYYTLYFSLSSSLVYTLRRDTP